MSSKTSYGPREPTEVELKFLKVLQLNQFRMRKAGYILTELSPDEIKCKARCGNCRKILVKMGYFLRVQPTLSDEPPHVCKFHSGRVRNRAWTCCKKPVWSQPCSGYNAHVPHQYAPGEQESNWLFHRTPPTQPGCSALKAVALDCEMGTASSGETELIRISMVDFFSGKVLVDSLVYPSVPMAHYNTRFSGVTRQAMEAARRGRKCFFGRDAVRDAVFKHVGPDTIVVGHACHQDLASMRWIHPNVVDTLLVETERRRLRLEDSERRSWELEDPAIRRGSPPDVFRAPQEGGLSLKALTFDILGRVIQRNGRGHDSLEDALATRDVLWYNIEYPPFLTSDMSKDQYPFIAEQGRQAHIRAEKAMIERARIQEEEWAETERARVEKEGAENEQVRIEKESADHWSSC